MKFNIVESERKFNPININITIENEIELIELIGRLDVNPEIVVDNLKENFEGEFKAEQFHNFGDLYWELFDFAVEKEKILDEIVEEIV